MHPRLRTPGAPLTILLAALLAILLALPTAAQAQDPPDPDRQKPPTSLVGEQKVKLQFFETDLGEVVKFMMDLRGENYLGGDINFKEKVTIVSQKQVSASAAWQAFLSALEVNGYTLVRTGAYYKIIKANEAVQAPVSVRTSEDVPASDQVITQLMPLDNISVGDVQSVVNALKSRNGNIIAYQPTNTLIITDHAYNIRKIYRIINELDVGSPRSSMEIIRLAFADAQEVQQIIEQLYGTAGSGTTAGSDSGSTPSTRRRRRRRNDEPEPTPNQTSVTAGKQAKYIDKVMADQRTNSLIVLANEEGMKAVKDLIAQLDVDATDNSRSKIYVVRLEQAKAQDVVDVLSRLSEGSGGASAGRPRTTNTRTAASARGNTNAGQAGGGEDAFGAIAAFDSGMRIAHDEATNSLVIIASPEDFRVVETVINELDRVRKQVFVDAVILEISSEDGRDIGIAGHVPGTGGDPTEFDPSTDNFQFLSGQLGTQSIFGLSQDVLSGLALGVFGPSFDVQVSGETVTIPAFGIVLNAIKTYTGTEIVSNPNLLTLDNAEAKIVVGRKVPFPTNTSFNNLGQPIVTFTREDVAVSLEITPRINSENYVTLEIRVEVSEVEEDDSGLDPLLSGGPVTSKREVETTALVKDNQTVVLGGLVGTTETEVETKIPVLGDVPLIGAMFRGTRQTSRKSNLIIFLTPHIIESEEDMVEVMRVKEAQFLEFRRRFYGKSREDAYREIQNLLQYSMNVVDRPSMYRGSDKGAGLDVNELDLSGSGGDGIREGMRDFDRNGNEVGTAPAGTAPDPGPATDDLGVPATDDQPVEGP